jgi:hypothetical protein
MGTTIGGRDAASTASHHQAAGPPAVSNIPPMTPATPPGVPAPFPYIADTSSASQTASKLSIGGGEAVVDDSELDIMPPGNGPSQPAPLHDIVTMMVNAKIVIG